MRLKSRDLPLLRSPVAMASQIYIQNFNFLAEFGGERRKKQPFFNVKEGGNFNISSSNRPRRLNFGYFVQLWIIYRMAEKETIFAILFPQHPLLQIWI